jgi:hypothetical protein
MDIGGGSSTVSWSAYGEHVSQGPVTRKIKKIKRNKKIKTSVKKGFTSAMTKFPKISQVEFLITHNTCCIEQWATAQSKTGLARGYILTEAPPVFSLAVLFFCLSLSKLAILSNIASPVRVKIQSSSLLIMIHMSSQVQFLITNNPFRTAQRATSQSQTGIFHGNGNGVADVLLVCSSWEELQGPFVFIDKVYGMR